MVFLFIGAEFRGAAGGSLTLTGSFQTQLVEFSVVAVLAAEASEFNVFSPKLAAQVFARDWFGATAEN